MKSTINLFTQKSIHIRIQEYQEEFGIEQALYDDNLSKVSYNIIWLT